MTFLKYFFISFLFLVSFSCKNDKKRESLNYNKKIPWQKISIISDSQSINIYSYKDSVVHRSWEIKDSLVKNEGIWHIPINEKKKYIFLTKEVKDTLSEIVMNIITKPVFSDLSVTDYAGNVKIYIEVGNTELSCRYSSVGNWTVLSENTKKLHKLLSRELGVNFQ